MERKFLKVPKDQFDRMIFAALLSEHLSGGKPERKTLDETIEKANLELTEEQQETLDELYPY